MNRRIHHLTRVPSLLLAAALQVLPIARAALPVTQSAANIIVVLFRWGSAAAAALGGVQAVSGASTTITNPLNATGTNGVPFSLRLTTAPDQAHYWLASGLPSDYILIGTSGATLWKIQGTNASAGTYNVTLTAKDQSNSGASKTVSSTLVLTVLSGGASPPSITTQPTSRSALAGSSTAFSVTASGSGLAYQWRHSSVNIGGATSSGLTLNSLALSDSGAYDVVITNASGSVTSVVATLTVTNPPPPSITSQPTSRSALAGSSTTISVTAAGSGLAYQWRHASVNIGGATSADLTLNSLSLADSGAYDVVITNAYGSVTSVVATLTVTNPPPPSITSQPTSRSALAGSSTTISVTAAGSGLAYQWRHSSVNIGGATSSGLTLNSLTLADSGAYDVVITNAYGSVTSVVATLTVTNPPPPSITSQPTSRSVAVGGSSTFSVTASGSGLAYQWRHSASNVSGATNSSLALTSISLSDAGSYDVIVTNAYGSVTSVVATLTVTNIPPGITTQPTSRTVAVGASTTFSVTATGTSLAYQWRHGASAIPGETGSSLALSGILLTDAGAYDVIVTNSSGSVTSSVATLTVTNPAPAITAQPTNRTVGTGTAVSFAVTASGANPLTYQWRLAASPVSGATNSVLSLASATLADAGAYDVIVANGYGSVTSVVATLTVTNAPLAIVSQPGDQEVLAGTDVSFVVSATGAPPLTYQWRFNGSNLGGATSPALNLTGVTTLDAGGYDVVVTGNGQGSVTSVVATLTVTNVPLAIVTQPVSREVLAGTSVSFVVSATGAPPLTYQWRFNGGNLVGATNTSVSLSGVSAPDAGGYDVVVTGNGQGSVTSVVATLTITNAPSDLPIAAYNGLFFDTNDLSLASAGFFTAKTGKGRTIAGSLRIGVVRYGFKGVLDGAGQATLSVLRGALTPLSLNLAAGDHSLSGTVSDGTWTSPLWADQAVFNAKTNPATAYAGMYTAIVPGAESDPDAPIGDGVASMKVDVGGNMLLTGNLADGTRLVEKCALSGAGHFPLYVPIPQNRGAIFGWLRLRPGGGSTLDGETHWLRPGGPLPRVNTNGFQLDSTVVGSVFQLAGLLSLSQGNANLVFSGGNLPDSFTNVLAFGAFGQMTNLSTNKLVMKLNPKTGLIGGIVVNPYSLKPVKFQAALLVNQLSLSGSFLGSNVVGRVEMIPVAQ